MIEFKSDHRAMALPNRPLTFVGGRIVVDQEGAEKLRRLARRKPYLRIEEVGPVVAPVSERAPAPRRRSRPAPRRRQPGDVPVEPATPADETGSGDSPASSDDTANG